jgi:hypothetical protein
VSVKHFCDDCSVELSGCWWNGVEWGGTSDSDFCDRCRQVRIQQASPRRRPCDWCGCVAWRQKDGVDECGYCVLYAAYHRAMMLLPRKGEHCAECSDTHCAGAGAADAVVMPTIDTLPPAPDPGVPPEGEVWVTRVRLSDDTALLDVGCGRCGDTNCHGSCEIRS